ncbi:hypothetical protein CVT26_013528 [Gymnopilus dilepis]|uniref:Uncharacterized protein n=1 Tax=Gymnopilus dilepis TaxID=231916 RepID=A0A409Y5H0_9AGAR|nr:hypothetical protein CVT26_013528 [Gymnopilus dilepis]
MMEGLSRNVDMGILGLEIWDSRSEAPSPAAPGRIWSEVPLSKDMTGSGYGHCPPAHIVVPLALPCLSWCNETWGGLKTERRRL